MGGCRHRKLANIFCATLQGSSFSSRHNFQARFIASISSLMYLLSCLYLSYCAGFSLLCGSQCWVAPENCVIIESDLVCPFSLLSLFCFLLTVISQCVSYFCLDHAGLYSFAAMVNLCLCVTDLIGRAALGILASLTTITRATRRQPSAQSYSALRLAVQTKFDAIPCIDMGSWASKV